MKATVGSSADSTFLPKRCSCSDFIFSESLFNHDTGTDSSFCLEDGSRSDSVRRRLERAVQREDSNAVRKFKISAATSWGRVVVRCLTFLPTHLEPVIQGLIMWIHGKDW